MKKYISFFVLASLFSCAKEAGPVEEIQPVRVPMHFSVEGEEFPDAVSKTQLDANTNIQWSTGNTCAIMCYNGSAFCSDKLTYNAETKMLDGDVSVTQDIYYAAYPRLEKGTTGGQVKLAWDEAKKTRYYEQSLVDEQKIDGVGTFSNGSCFSVAFADKDNTSLKFKNLCSFFRLTIPKDLKNSLNENVAVTSVDMSPIKLDESFRGTYRVNCPKELKDEPEFSFTSKSEGERFLTIKKSNGNFGAGDYYLCAPAITSTYGLKVDIHFSDNSVHTVFAYGEKEYKRNTIYKLGTLKYGAELMLVDADEIQTKPTWITNADHVTLSDNPKTDERNPGSKALKVSKTGSEGTTGYFKITYCSLASNPTGPVNHDNCRKYNGMKLSVYCEKAKDVYFFVEFGGSSKRLPSRVNGKAISNAVDYNAAIMNDAWNVLEFDLKDYDSSKSTANNYQSFGLRPFCNQGGGDSAVSNRIAYIDDIELIWK